ncbi:MAG: hypothetical protein WCH84_00230 [Verrucomicrobiota bacterium]
MEFRISLLRSPCNLTRIRAAASNGTPDGGQRERDLANHRAVFFTKKTFIKGIATTGIKG